MKAAIINIGSEILKGLTLNTNLQWLSSEIDAVGIEVVLGLSTRDYEEEIIDYLKLAFKKADLIITTGGLGPTGDDITRESIIKAFNLKSEISQELMDLQQNLYGHVYKKMALVPMGATVILPERGTAAGWHFSVEGRIIFVLPGVPDEMQHMTTSHIVPFLKDNVVNDRKTVVLRFYDIKEVQLEGDVASFYDVQYGLLPKKGIVDVYMSATGRDFREAEEKLKGPAKYLIKKFKNNYLGERNATFEDAINKKLLSSKKTLSCTESVTGGLISDRITNAPGISAHFKGGIVAYSNEAKHKLLKVKESSLKKYGAVSAQVAEEMANGGRSLYDTDYCLSSTGIAGPSGAVKNKPVGLNYIGLASKSGVKTKELRLLGSRWMIKNRVANEALLMLLKELS
jgi:nicotinamide-nucleotide amidase